MQQSFANTTGGALEDAGLDPWRVPALIGQELASAVQSLDAALRRLRASGAINGADWLDLTQAVRSVHRTALTSQQLSRLAEGRLRQAMETISLGKVIDAVLDENGKAFTARGVQVELQVRPADVSADAALLHALVQSAIQYCAGDGAALFITTRVRNWPQNAELLIRARHSVATPGTPADEEKEETLGWVMVSQFSRAMGVVARRETQPNGEQLVLEFPRTVNDFGGLTAIEIDHGEAGHMHGARPLAGLRVLLLTNDALVRGEMEATCRRMGLVLDVVNNVERAVRYCELDKPHGIVVDSLMHNREFDELRGDLLRYDPNFPFLEIASEDVVAMSSWQGDNISRIGRSALRQQLDSMLAMELAKAA